MASNHRRFEDQSRLEQLCQQARNARATATVLATALQRVYTAIEQRRHRTHRPTDPPIVLVVDDEHAVRVVVGRLLTDAGYHVLLARSGPEALEIARKTPGPVHVLLSDLRMPGMDGARLAIKIQRILPNTRVVMMAAYPSEDALGWPVVVKPFEPGELERAIQKVLQEGSLASTPLFTLVTGERH